MRKFLLIAEFFLFALPCAATNYFISPTGNDSNNGTSSGTPWLTTNHALNGGDLINMAAGTYSEFNFTTGTWGTVTCSGHCVAHLHCVTFNTCKISATSVNGMWIDKSHWMVDGVEVTVNPASDQFGACFVARPPVGAAANIQDIIFANDIANGCAGSGFSAANQGNFSVDYFVAVGDIAYNAAQGNGECFAGFSVYEPVAVDTLPGTHIYIAGDFGWDNVVPNPCGGLTNPTYDGEGITFDSLNGEQGGLPSAYAQQVVADNSIMFLNGAFGAATTGSGNTAANVFLRHLTLYGNMKDTNQNFPQCGQAVSFGNPDQSLNVVMLENLAQTTLATGGACGSGNPQYVFYVYNGNGTDRIYNNYGYSAAGNNVGSSNSTGFSAGPNNIFGTNPSFANPVDPGAPSCGSATSVPNCMATVIANFTPTVSAAKSYGYQIPVAGNVYDPLFPAWLCNVNLPAGLVSMGCLPGAGTTAVGGAQITSGVKIQ
jgi:hypothetical protein